MNSQTLHFDSIQSNYSKTDPIETIYRFTEPIKNIKKISLQSIEIPIGFTNIRSDNTSNIFTIQIGSITSSITLSNNNYTSISTLLTAINTAFIALSLTNIPTFTTSNNKIIITLSTSSTIIITQSTLSRYILGFYNNSFIGSSCISLNNYNLSYDTYISMNISNLSVLNQVISNQQTTFKIPFSGVNSTIYYLYENSSFSQHINLCNNNDLSFLNVKFYDRLGYQIINNNGLDYSFSLLIEYNN